MSPVSKRQQTLAKRKREQAVEEKRTLKREKKRAAAAAKAAGLPPPGEEQAFEEGEALDGEIPESLTDGASAPPDEPGAVAETEVDRPPEDRPLE